MLTQVVISSANPSSQVIAIGIPWGLMLVQILFNTFINGLMMGWRALSAISQMI